MIDTNNTVPSPQKGLLENGRYCREIGFLYSVCISGELFATQAYSLMSLMPKDKNLIRKLLNEAQEELSHACMLEKLGNKLDVPFANNILEPEWYTVLNYFKEKVRENDFISCFIIQEVMMESLAIVIYEVLSGDGTITDTETAKLEKHILQDEINHVDYGVDFLKQEIAKNPEQLHQKLKETHDFVMPNLFNLARYDCTLTLNAMGVECGTFGAEDIGSDLDTLRLRALDRYISTLEAGGVNNDLISELLLNISGYSNKDSAASQRC